MGSKTDVYEVEITYSGAILKAHYSVKDGIIHAEIGGRTSHVPVGHVAPADTVRAMLQGYAIERYGISYSLSK